MATTPHERPPLKRGALKYYEAVRKALEAQEAIVQEIYRTGAPGRMDVGFGDCVRACPQELRERYASAVHNTVQAEHDAVSSGFAWRGQHLGNVIWYSK